ncbi:MFS transporter [Pseudonocardia petroleophila]|uniref:Putative proline/betaine transporter n=1 Tax=Pseudonocardia petroleophila TaxID=37331 RepID=A0A7G7MCD0_9PSEU|nr:MFS transporter [Pseudonocardia petroleophila]QNG50441.1 MHS family MFS transporter [Pseudonocardia petroleophila]
MVDEDSGGAPPERVLRRVAAAALSASTLEWYDFYIYGTAAALVFNTVFFPSVSPVVGTLAAFATFGVGFLFRPVGGVVFGHFGDRMGRKRMLVVAMVMMGVATTLIGLLPTYATIGVAAPILLVLLRCVQGLAIGGQYGGAMLLVTENAPPHRRGFYGSFAQMGPSLAVILSNVVFLVLIAALPAEAFASWGWRVPFLLSVLVIGLGLYIQLKIEDTPDFRSLQDSAPEPGAAEATPIRPRSPLVEALRTHPRQILQSGGMILVIQVYYYILIVFMVSYVGTLGVARSTILTIILISSGATVLTIPLFATLSDRVGRKRVLVPAGAATLLSAFPFFWLMETATVPGMLVAALTAGIVLGGLYGPMAAFFTEMFSTSVRYSGASVGYQLGAVVGGGFAPLIAASLLAATGTINAVAAFVAVAAVLTLVSIVTTKESYRPVPRPGAADRAVPQSS